MSDEYFGTSNEETVKPQENEAITPAAPELNVSPASESVLAGSNNALPEESLQNMAANAPQPAFPVNETNNNENNNFANNNANNNANNVNNGNNFNYNNDPMRPYMPNNAYNYYQQPAYKEEPLTLGEWVLTLILLYIPVVGFIMTIIWACGVGNNISRRNFARANLIVRIVACILAIFFAVVCFLTAMALGYRFYLPF